MIQVHDRTIPYTVRRSTRARHVRISVNCDGAVLVTHPIRLPFVRIEEIVSKKLGWIMSKIEFFQKLGVIQVSREESIKLRGDAFKLVRSRIEHFNKFYGFSVGNVFIRNQRTRWGSCSRRGNLNFNYRIARLSSELVDYIVVHELCHLAELNHSKKFWKLIEQTQPRYNELRKALKQTSL